MIPLADRMRPASLDEILGQDHLVGPGAPFRRALEGGRLRSCVLWGPPGTGKTTIARCLAAAAGMRFVQLSAVLSGTKDLKEVIDAIPALDPRGTLLFVDEIHRWNKAQQDALLPHVESVLAEFPDKVAEYRSGKTGLAGFFTGQTIRRAGKGADPKRVQVLLRERLDR